MESQQRILQNRPANMKQKALEDELAAKEKQWELAEKDYETRQALIDFMENSTEREILNHLHLHVKALASSITVYSPTSFTVLWFDGTETESRHKPSKNVKEKFL